MKIKSLLFLLIISLGGPLIGMDTRQNTHPALPLALNKHARLSVLKNLWSQALDHTNATNDARSNIFKYFELFNYLTIREIIIVSSSLNHILKIPQENISPHSEDFEKIYSILLKLKKRKMFHQQLKRASLEYQCLYALRNISLTNFNRLHQDLQHKLVCIHGKKRTDLLYAYAEKNMIDLRLTRMIISRIKRIKRIHIRLYGPTHELNKIFPKEILQHNNDKILTYVLLNQN